MKMNVCSKKMELATGCNEGLQNDSSNVCMKVSLMFVVEPGPFIEMFDYRSFFATQVVIFTGLFFDFSFLLL